MQIGGIQSSPYCMRRERELFAHLQLIQNIQFRGVLKDLLNNFTDIGQCNSME